MERFKGLRVLVVDDDDDLLESMCDLVRFLGCRVSAAKSLDEARDEVDLILCESNFHHLFDAVRVSGATRSTVTETRAA